MKFLICGDLHITNKTPENRIDNYFETQFNKIKWIITLANTLNSFLIFPGDVFDSYKQSNFVLQTYISLFATAKYPIFAIFGQHDMKYHSIEKEDTPLAVLEAANVLTIVKKETEEDIIIYGVSFEEEITSIEKQSKFTLLLTHQMIIHNDKIWNDQVGYIYAENLLRKHKFDLIVSGDNHHFFIAEQGNKLLVNCGSLMRSTTAQLNHIPKVVLFDTETRKYKEYEVPVKPISEVFNLEKITIKKEKEEKFDVFIKGLNESKSMNFSFQDSLDDYIKENKIGKEIEEIIMEAVNG